MVRRFARRAVGWRLDVASELPSQARDDYRAAIRRALREAPKAGCNGPGCSQETFLCEEIFSPIRLCCRRTYARGQQ